MIFPVSLVDRHVSFERIGPLSHVTCLKSTAGIEQYPFVGIENRPRNAIAIVEITHLFVVARWVANFARPAVSGDASRQVRCQDSNSGTKGEKPACNKSISRGGIQRFPIAPTDVRDLTHLAPRKIRYEELSRKYNSRLNALIQIINPGHRAQRF